MRRKIVLINNLSRPLASPIQANYCSSFVCRLRGLTFRRRIEPSDGLLLVQKRESRLDASIHMLFVWMDLAIVWMNNEKVVVDMRHARRWSLIYSPQTPAKFVLEINPDHSNGIKIGDQLDFEEPLAD